MYWVRAHVENTYNGRTEAKGPTIRPEFDVKVIVMRRHTLLGRACPNGKTDGTTLRKVEWHKQSSHEPTSEVYRETYVNQILKRVYF